MWMRVRLFVVGAGQGKLKSRQMQLVLTCRSCLPFIIQMSISTVQR